MRTRAAMTLFPMEVSDRVVNVASVPQRSPFRYPGGKTWLVPHIRDWMVSLGARPEEFVEPFAGGASVGLAVGMEGLAAHVTLVESDEDVCAVWSVIFGGHAEELARRVVEFGMSRAAVVRLLSETPRTQVDLAFRTLVRNRVLHGGILAPGASLMRKGENGKGLRSRWYPETLHRRITSLGAQHARFSVVCGDGIELMRSATARGDAVFFIDPPYTVAGRRLYAHHQVDHELLFRVCADLRGEFLMTYDDADDIRVLARNHGFRVATVPMKSRQHRLKRELLISRRLDWVT